jgi:hypothetical protein
LDFDFDANGILDFDPFDFDPFELDFDPFELDFDPFLDFGSFGAFVLNKVGLLLLGVSNGVGRAVFELVGVTVVPSTPGFWKKFSPSTRPLISYTGVQNTLPASLASTVSDVTYSGPNFVSGWFSLIHITVASVMNSIPIQFDITPVPDQYVVFFESNALDAGKLFASVEPTAIPFAVLTLESGLQSGDEYHSISATVHHPSGDTEASVVDFSRHAGAVVMEGAIAGI